MEANFRRTQSQTTSSSDSKAEDTIAETVTLKLRSPAEAMKLLGHNDENLKLLRERFNAKIIARGDELRLSGAGKDVKEAERTFRSLLNSIRKGNEVSLTELRHAEVSSLGEAPGASSPTIDKLPRRARPKTAGQRTYVETIAGSAITFGIGPAGTGKTYLAVAMAALALKDRKVKRIILTRPAVEAGEKLGFLPGDLQAKIDPYLRPLYDALYDMMDSDKIDAYLESGAIEVAPLAFMRGRAQPLDSLVATPLGWRKMGELEPGDAVTGSDGKPTQVLGVYPQGVKEIYRVTMTDGSTTLCCAEHLWQVRTPSDKRRGKMRVLETHEMIGSLRSAHQHRYEIPTLSAPVSLPERAVPLDPYALGLLLGDGCMTTSTTPSFSSADAELVEALEHALAPLNINLVHKSGVDYCLNERGKSRGGVITANPVTQVLRDLDLAGCRSSTKFVPECYLYNSAEVRLAVLQGLLDSDGGPVTQSERSCRIQYTSTSQQLKDDVLFLVRSLGGVAYWRKCVAAGRTPGRAEGRDVHHRADAYILDIRLPAELAPFRLTRKLSSYQKTGGGRPMRFIKSIELVGSAETQCIRVAAADHLYVTDDFIVTHNTLNDAFIILDEAQNTTSEQMKMFLTRMGFNSTVVVTGDATQTDLPGSVRSGLGVARNILSDIDGINFVTFKDSDVVRHPLVASIVRAYETLEVRRDEAPERQSKEKPGQT